MRTIGFMLRGISAYSVNQIHQHDHHKNKTGLSLWQKRLMIL